MLNLPASEVDALVVGPWAERVMLGLSVSALRGWVSAWAALATASDRAMVPAAAIAVVSFASFVDILLSEAWMKHAPGLQLNPSLDVNSKASAVGRA
jgi:hypothetical protein